MYEYELFYSKTSLVYDYEAVVGTELHRQKTIYK